MIYKGEKEIIGINIGERPISAIYLGDKLVWQAVRSCFGNGYWDDDKPWDDDEGWKN